MRYTKYVLFGTMVACLLVSGLVACSDEDQTANPTGQPQATESDETTVESTIAESTSVTIVDSVGNTVEIPQPLERVAMVYPYHLEVFWALGAEDQIVSIPDGSVDSFAMYAKFKGMPEAGYFRTSASIEKLVELDAQVVISLVGSLSVEDLDERLAPFDIPVVRLDLYKIDTLAQEIETLGKMLGKEEEAKAYVDYFQAYLDLVDEKLAQVGEEGKTKAYFEFFRDYVTQSRASGGHQMLVMAGAENIAADLSIELPTVSPEWVVDENPDVIFKTQLPQLCPSGWGVTDSSPIEAMLEGIKNRPSWDLIKAVQEDRVYFISSDFFCSPRAPLGILYMAKCLYPDLFADIDPDEVNQEWMMKYHGIDGSGLYCLPKVQ